MEQQGLAVLAGSQVWAFTRSNEKAYVRARACASYVVVPNWRLLSLIGWEKGNSPRVFTLRDALHRFREG